AIEPFATTGKGRVIDTEFLEIYSIEEPKKVRLPASRALLEAASKYELLPFATRWFAKEFDVQSPSFKLALADLTRQKVFHPYHGLREASGGLVSQAETTVIVQENDCKPLTPPLSL
ncbi:MAG: type II methionyl aminopeptidase, partial [Candidatus Norongarragalinales archaeon]